MIRKDYIDKIEPFLHSNTLSFLNPAYYMWLIADEYISDLEKRLSIYEKREKKKLGKAKIKGLDILDFKEKLLNYSYETQINESRSDRLKHYYDYYLRKKGR